MATIVDQSPQRMSRTKTALALILFIALLAIAWGLYSMNRTADAPAQSTTETRPNGSQNNPPGGSVTEGGNPSDDATPNPTGTGNNTLLNQ